MVIQISPYKYHLKGAFDRRFEFSFLGLEFLIMLSPRIVFPSMCFLEYLVDELNSRKYFAYFQKYPWQRATVAGGGPTAVEGNRQ